MHVIKQAVSLKMSLTAALRSDSIAVALVDAFLLAIATLISALLRRVSGNIWNKLERAVGDPLF